jgi:release factor glutamine methyltransferase
VKLAMTSGVDRAAGELRTALRSGIARLEVHNVPSAPLAAELLLMHILQRDRAWLYAHPEYELNTEAAATYAQLIERRSKGVPTQYLTGRQEFWGLEFAVGPGVLIPRPETEHLIEVALERCGRRRREPLRIADLGTGSGCIAIALAQELPNARIIATDISAAALDYAQRNSARHEVSARIQFLAANLLDAGRGLSGLPRKSFDMIVSNPPYLGRNAAANLPREVREHEPPEALFAGETGFEIYPALIEEASKSLCPKGIFVVEIGYDGADYVCSLLSAPSWSELIVTRDLAGIERVISARFSG